MKHQSITTLPPSPEIERRTRMIKYTVAMSIRVLCIVAMLFVEGWWLAVFAVGAIFLPYFAVVLANVKHQDGRQTVLRPGTVMPLPRTGPAAEAQGEEGGKA
jgi:predicted tellurium resistance membrane protein TerC